MRFSERNGYKPVRQIIQKDNMDESLKIGIWNVFHTWANSNMRCDSFKSLMIINKLSKLL